MTTDQIETLAKKDKVTNKLETGKRLLELKSMNCSIIEFIHYIKINQNCSLAAAQDIVINSNAWMDGKVAFLHHQEDMELELLSHGPKQNDQEQTYFLR